MHAFSRSNFGVVTGKGTALLFNTKDFSLFLCVGEVSRSLLLREVRLVAGDHCTRNSFALGKFEKKRISPIEVLTKDLLQGCQKSLKLLSQIF